MKLNIKTKDKNGITLVALVVTVLVLIVLAGVSINLVIGNNGIVTKAQIAKTSTELAKYKEELSQWKINKKMEDNNFIEDTLSAGKNNLAYGGVKQEGNIKTIIQDLDDSYLDEVEIIKGELIINTTNKSKLEGSKIAEVSSNPYIIKDGELKSAGANLELMSSDGTVTIPENVTKIGAGAFSGLAGLKTVIIPETVKEVGAYAFAYNKTLEKVIMQEGTKTIGDKAFFQCYNLSEINLPNTITSIGEFSMASSKITNLNVPSSLKTIKTYAFLSLTNLVTVNIPEGVEKIESSAFSGCTKLEAITIPSTVTDIKNGAFSNCNNLIQINLNTNKFTYESGMLLPEDKSEIIFVSKKILENTDTFKIPEGIQTFTINLGNFTNIKNVSIPKSLINMRGGIMPKYVENITIAEGNTNFYVENKQLYKGTTLLMSYTGKESVTVKTGTITIGNYAFSGEKNAKEIILPNSVENIGEYIMSDLSKLQKLKIGKNASNIPPQFNYGALNVQIELDVDNKNYTIVNNVLYNYDKTKLICALYPITGNLEIESTVKEIGEYAFYGQNEMQGITLPNGVEKIGGNILLRCSKITKLEIPSSIKEISSAAFNETAHLDEIIIHKKEGSVTGSPWGVAKGERAIKWVGEK